MSQRNKDEHRDKQAPARTRQNEEQQNKPARQERHEPHIIPGADGFIGAEAEEDNNP